MKSFLKYLEESELRAAGPVVGDILAINIKEDTLVESFILDIDDDSVTLNADQTMIDILESNGYYVEELSEAKYQGRTVPLNKPMKGDVAKSKVYVKDPKTGNIKKVNFGDKNMKIKKSNPARRKSFRARHNCANPGPKTKARYWSCRAW
jgi:hypothetical protein